MFSSLKSILVGIPLIAQVAVGGAVSGLSAAGIAVAQTKQCHQQSLVTTHYSSTSAVTPPHTTVEDGSLPKDQEKIVSNGVAGQEKVEHTVTKHCGKFLNDVASAPVVIKSPVAEVKNIGTAYDATESSTVEYGKQSVADSTQLRGTSGVRSAGTSGTKQTTYHYAKNAGEEQTKAYVSEAVTVAAVDEIDWYGVKEPPAAYPVKLSRNLICHAPGTTYYEQTIYFTPYNTLSECLQHGRLPYR